MAGLGTGRAAHLDGLLLLDDRVKHHRGIIYTSLYRTCAW